MSKCSKLEQISVWGNLLNPEKMAKALKEELEKKFVGMKNTEATRELVSASMKTMMKELEKAMYDGGVMTGAPEHVVMSPKTLEDYKKLMDATLIDPEEVKRMIMGEFPMDVEPPPDHLFEKDFMDELKNT